MRVCLVLYICAVSVQHSMLMHAYVFMTCFKYTSMVGRPETFCLVTHVWTRDKGVNWVVSRVMWRVLGLRARRYERLFVAEVESTHERETTLEASTLVCLAWRDETILAGDCTPHSTTVGVQRLVAAPRQVSVLSHTRWSGYLWRYVDNGWVICVCSPMYIFTYNVVTVDIYAGLVFCQYYISGNAKTYYPGVC